MNNADVAQAARLVRYGLQPRLRPTPDSDYRVLFDRYRTDAEFEELVVQVAEGLGLYLRTPTHLGLIAAGDPDGPFAVTLDNCGLPIRTGEKRLQDRRCFGLVLTALAAFAYPNGEALVESSSPTVRPPELERFVTAKAQAVNDAVKAAEAAGEADELDVQLGAAARFWLEDLPEVLPAERGTGYRRDCRRWYVQTVLSFLVDTGRARREAALSDERGDAYALNDRFRVGISEVAETLTSAIYATSAASTGRDA